MNYELPTTVEVNGTEYEIRSDYRDILTILEAMSDDELTDQDKAEVLLVIFYPDFNNMLSSNYEEAVRQCISFINGGVEEDRKKLPKLMDWQQDFSLIIAPVNRVLGKEARAEKYMHWYTWLAAYQEIGDCTFAQVVAIRNKKLKGKKLDKSEQEFYKRNRSLVDFKKTYTEQDDEVISQWI